MMIIMLASLGLMVAVMAMLPEMSRPTVPLGVSVPSERVKDPIVRAAIRRFRRWVLLGGVIAAVTVLVCFTAPELSVLALLGYVAWNMVVFAVCRRPILNAKADQGWYDRVPVGVSVSVTPEKPASPLWSALILAAGISLAAAVMVAVNYAALPDLIPTHYDATGNATSWEPKNWINALLLPLLAVATVLITAAVSVAISRRQAGHFPDGRPQAARNFQHGTDRSMQRVLAALALVSAVGMSALAVAPLVEFTPAGIAWISWGLVAASSLPIIWLVIDTARNRRTLVSISEYRGAESPDDDHLWKWGMFYLNREDPRMLVPKRNGIGLDANLGHPGGIAIMGFAFLAVLGTFALLLTVSRLPE